MSRRSLAGQLLALQLALVAVVVLVVGGVFLAQSDVSFRAVEGRRLLAAAETTAAQSLLRRGLSTGDGQTVSGVAGRVADLSGASYVVVADAEGRVVASTRDPGLVGRPLPFGGTVLRDGRRWDGVASVDGVRSVAAAVPVLSEERGRVGRVLGVVVAGRAYPGLGERLRQALRRC